VSEKEYANVDKVHLCFILSPLDREGGVSCRYSEFHIIN
jgi:hypothetical protein